jgi:hypothetical protein
VTYRTKTAAGDQLGAGMKSSASEAIQHRAAAPGRQKSPLRRRSQIRFLGYCSLDARDVIRGTERHPTRTFCWK